MEEALKKRKGYTSPKSILTYHYTFCNLKESYGQILLYTILPLVSDNLYEKSSVLAVLGLPTFGKYKAVAVHQQTISSDQMFILFGRDVKNHRQAHQ